MKIGAEGPRNVLLLQNRRDASTPHRGGKMLRKEFGDRARLVSVDDSGHGVYVLRAEHHHALPRRGRDAHEGHGLPRGLTTPSPIGPTALRGTILIRSLTGTQWRAPGVGNLFLVQLYKGAVVCLLSENRRSEMGYGLPTYP
ncbi:alpha/beta hydrolase [Streptomyces sp. NPDC058818]|uniref:alpha/beta hydrolase n=1 Tax=Streptomyces sp. NPDC058818 TaxID=3346640 RepID=UPI00367F0AC9